MVAATLRTLVLSIAAASALSASTAACPFCTAVKPTLAQRREAATVAALAEALDDSSQGTRFKLHQFAKGKERLAGKSEIVCKLDESFPAGKLVLMFGQESPKGQPLAWTAQGLGETSYGYFLKSPDLRQPAAERLRYFAKHLESSDPVAAEDAFNEFGHAPYEDVVRAADAFPAAKLREWLHDDGVQQQRQGFYGLALGLAGGNDEQRDANREFLKQLVLRPADDFRAGFDGVLAGYLVCGGLPALELIERRYFSDPASADGDVRHALAALRFCQQYVHEIPTARLAKSIRPLIARAEFADEAIVDLARWQDWESLPQVAALYKQDSLPAAATRRAIAGYLINCPLPAATAELARIRAFDPKPIEQAQRGQFFPGAAKD